MSLRNQRKSTNVKCILLVLFLAALSIVLYFISWSSLDLNKNAKHHHKTSTIITPENILWSQNWYRYANTVCNGDRIPNDYFHGPTEQRHSDIRHTHETLVSTLWWVFVDTTWDCHQGELGTHEQCRNLFKTCCSANVAKFYINYH